MQKLLVVNDAGRKNILILKIDLTKCQQCGGDLVKV
jgi:hypothetical protein